MFTIKNVIIVTPDKVPFPGYAVIKNDMITETAEGEPPEQNGLQVIDGGGSWLLPGFVNTHGHAGSSLLRGAGDDIPLDVWLKTVMWPNEQKFDKEIVDAATDLALLEMTKSGTTAFLDMYHLHMSSFADKIADRGFQAVLGRGMIGLGSSSDQKERLIETEHLIQNYHGAADKRLHIAVTPHAPYTCPPAFISDAAELAAKYQVLFHTHCAETRKEVEEHIETYGMHPVEHLKQLGVLELPVLLAHAVHVSEQHIQLLAKHKTSVSHNPTSNLKLGSGIAPVAQMRNNGIKVALGTDSTASNNTLDMVEEMKIAALIHKGAAEDPTATNAEDIFQSATVTGAEALLLENRGRIAAGYKADMMLVRPETAHLQPVHLERIKSHLVYALKSSDIQDLWIHGKKVMADRETTTLDEEKIIYEANKQAQKLR